MKKEDSAKYLQMLGQELQKKQVVGEIIVADDVVLLLDIRQPGASEDEDIDAYFGGHGRIIREAVISIAGREGLPHDWLSEALRYLFDTQMPRKKWVEYPGLRIYISPVDYALALKVAAGSPKEDIKVLAEKLHISSAQDMFALITKYVPEQLLTPEMLLSM